MAIITCTVRTADNVPGSAYVGYDNRRDGVHIEVKRSLLNRPVPEELVVHISEPSEVKEERNAPNASRNR